MRRRLLRLALVALGLSVVAWMVVRLGPAEVLRTAREADPTWLGLSVLVLVG
ncbi:MAG: hypothetical protein GWN32_13280, partial [Gemmatimonadetes bacterium]|nr:hypothetical protein [Pseudomonadales bacterium]NIW37446.1 hypothetical protein [Gemmatimonadota bacterium]NIX08226.1 hypothetical protein [Pseudomonadales bacterium]